MPGPNFLGLEGRIAIVQAQVFLLAVILIAQLWLITDALYELLSGRTTHLGWLALVGAFCSLGLASAINLVNLVQAMDGSGLVLETDDTLNVTLGLFGFLLPMAPAMSARSLPMYAGLDGFPRRILWPLAGVYFAGLALLCLESSGSWASAEWRTLLDALGMILLGGVVLLFVGIFLSLVRRRGRIPERVAKLAPSPQTLTQAYQQQITREQTHYGPFVGLVASA
jgi:hypothetical protein